MNAGEHPINRDDAIAELDAQIRHATGALKGLRGSIRCSLMDWISALEDARQSVMEGMANEAQVRSLLGRVCRLPELCRRTQVGHDGERQVWITTGEAMSHSVAIVRHLGSLLRTQIECGDESP